jgi:hypothetical protein
MAARFVGNRTATQQGKFREHIFQYYHVNIFI